jgi:hypothetical protein
MPTNRRRQTRNAGELVTPAAVNAWKARDWSTVDRELRLKPWECSPAWCQRFRNGGEPCRADEPHRGCVRAQELRKELEELSHAD